MPTHKELHLIKATSVDARISREWPKIARLNLMLVGGDFFAVEISRYVLERLIVRAQRAIREAPLPARRRPSISRSATSPNKWCTYRRSCG